MAKIKMTDETPKVPPMPATKEEVLETPPGQLIGSEINEQPSAVSEALAGDLIALPFDGAHLIWPDAEPLSEAEKERLAGPFARIMEKYGLGKIAKDEILLAFYLTACIYGRVKAVHEAKKKEKMMEETK